MTQQSQARPLVHIANQIFNRPVAMTERWAATLISAVHNELNVRLIETVEGRSINSVQMGGIAADARQAVSTRRGRRGEYQIFDSIQGVAVIPISGTLTRTWGLDPYSGFTGYDGIKAKLVAAMEDDAIDAILLDIESPGGAVSGLFDLADLVWSFSERNGGKPIWAMANELAASAAFALYTSADRHFVTRTSEVGSVGVLQMHYDVQKMNEQDGVKVTIFRAGQQKARVNPYEDIPADAVDRIQVTLDEMRDEFISLVARNLSATSSQIDALKKTVRETEGLTYIGRHAREIGFASAIASEDQVWAELLKRLGR